MKISSNLSRDDVTLFRRTMNHVILNGTVNVTVNQTYRFISVIWCDFRHVSGHVILNSNQTKSDSESGPNETEWNRIKTILFDLCSQMFIIVHESCQTCSICTNLIKKRGLLTDYLGWHCLLRWHPKIFAMRWTARFLISHLLF